MSKYKIATKLNKNFTPVRFKTGGKPHFQIFFELSSEEDQDLSEIAEVEYILHPTFKRRIRKASDPNSNFRTEIKAWGTFEVKAKLMFKNGETDIISTNMKDRTDIYI